MSVANNIQNLQNIISSLENKAAGGGGGNDISVSHDGNGNVILDGVTATFDENGNVVMN